MNYFLLTTIFLTVSLSVLAYYYIRLKKQYENSDKNESALTKEYYDLLAKNKSLVEAVELMGNTIDTLNDKYDNAVVVMNEYIDKYNHISEAYESLTIRFKELERELLYAKEDLEYAQMIITGDVDNWN